MTFQQQFFIGILIFALVLLTVYLCANRFGAPTTTIEQDFEELLSDFEKELIALHKLKAEDLMVNMWEMNECELDMYWSERGGPSLAILYGEVKLDEYEGIDYVKRWWAL
jgi:hypothetical protein